MTDISYSDNSHIFGVPFIIHEHAETSVIPIKREDLRDWIEKVSPLGIEFHFEYE